MLRHDLRGNLRAKNPQVLRAIYISLREPVSTQSVMTTEEGRPAPKLARRKCPQQADRMDDSLAAEIDLGNFRRAFGGFERAFVRGTNDDTCALGANRPQELFPARLITLRLDRRACRPLLEGTVAEGILDFPQLVRTAFGDSGH
jgi:hypothetical protein